MKCPLGAFGYPRGGRRRKLQITYGLTCSRQGRRVAIEVCGGGVHDDATLPEAAGRLKQRFGIGRVVFAGDRGMVTQAGVEVLREHGFDWITALGATQVQKLAARASSSSPCSTSATWPRSRARGSPASGSSSAASRTSRQSGRAAARSCLPRPSGCSPRSRPRSTRRAGASTALQPA